MPSILYRNTSEDRKPTVCFFLTGGEDESGRDGTSLMCHFYVKGL